MLPAVHYYNCLDIELLALIKNFVIISYVSKFDIIFSKVVRLTGVRFESNDGHGRRYHVKRLKKGEKLLLRREPSNPKDENAVMVLNTDEKLLGYIPRVEARQLAAYMDAGEKAAAVVKEIDYQPGKLCECRIKVAIYRENY